MENSLSLAQSSIERATPQTFHATVLGCLPTPILVLGADGVILYANRAVFDFLGYAPSSAEGATVFDIIMPSDRGWVREVFDDRRNSERSDRLVPPSARVRFLAADGEPLAADVTPAAPRADDLVGGTVVEIRPASTNDLLAKILAGVSADASQPELLSLLAQFIAMEPLDVEAAVLQRSAGHWKVLASTAPALSEVLEGLEPEHFSKMVARPQAVDLSGLDRLGAQLETAGCRSMWRRSVDSDLIDDNAILRFELILASPHDLAVASAISERLDRAYELARLIMKALNDRRLLTAADFDELTGLLTRAALTQRIETLPRGRSDATTTNSLIFLDLDGFKPVNDTYGHAAGDTVLKVVAERIQAAVRGDDVVARIGGDEFVVMLLDTSQDPKIQEMIADRIIASISAPISIAESDLMVSVSASAGFAIGCVDEPLQDVMVRADRLMYEAKSLGGGMVRFEGCAVTEELDSAER